jgi:hypothetical protein
MSTVKNGSARLMPSPLAALDGMVDASGQDIESRVPTAVVNKVIAKSAVKDVAVPGGGELARYGANRWKFRCSPVF